MHHMNLTLPSGFVFNLVLHQYHSDSFSITLPTSDTHRQKTLTCPLFLLTT